MPLYTADALILRTYKLSEADRIVVFLTRDRGKKRGVAKGARRARSRFTGALEPLTEVQLAYFERERRELVGINYAEPVRSPLALGAHAALEYVGYFAELLDEWAQEADADERLYRLGASMLEAMTRTSADWVRSSPTGSNWPSWSTRNNLLCNSMGISPTSSRKSVPPSARAKRPARSRAAPVKAPRTWPKNSLSKSSRGTAAQFTRTRGRPARALFS